MGCIDTKVLANKEKKFTDVTISNGNIEPVLTEEQVLLLEDSWDCLKKDITKVGVVTFMNLFQTHPEVQDAFLPFQQLHKEDMEHSAILRSHALRVMGTVDKCLARIRSPEKLRKLILELGGRHVNYNARYDFVDLIGPQFVYSIKPHLEGKWNDELEGAWTQLFLIVSYNMKKGMLDAPVVAY